MTMLVGLLDGEETLDTKHLPTRRVVRRDLGQAVGYGDRQGMGCFS